MKEVSSEYQQVGGIVQFERELIEKMGCDKGVVNIFVLSCAGDG